MNICSKCRYPNKPNRLSCLNCGSQLSDDPDIKMDDKKARYLSFNFWKIGTIILGFIILTGTGWLINSRLIPTEYQIKMPQVFKPQETQLDGEIFIVTRGGQNYKLGLVTVSFSRVLDDRRIETIFETKTNSDGKFSATLPQGNYKISAWASRYVFGKTEYYHWNVPITLNQEKQTLFLSNDNLTESP